MNWDYIRSIAASPKSYAADWHENSNKDVIGYFCSYVPEEIITASGALPYRILPDTDRIISKADAHLQSYCCGIVRGALEDALSGELNFISTVVFPHTCDSIQRLSDIWRINFDSASHVDLLVPAKLNTQSAYDYFKSILVKFKAQIQELTGQEITPERLHTAIRTHNNIRRHLARIYELHSQYPDLITSGDLYSLLKAATVMDRLAFVNELEEMLPALEKQRKTPVEKPAKRIVLSGGACNLPDLYSIIARHGAQVIWDDFCSGARSFEGLLAEDKNPFEAMVDRYVHRNICPAKHSDLTHRGDHLIKAVQQKKADGVIFLRLKFCDPHAFDYPYLREMLVKADIPCVLIEIDPQQRLSEQVRTRCEAFIEML